MSPFSVLSSSLTHMGPARCPRQPQLYSEAVLGPGAGSPVSGRWAGGSYSTRVGYFIHRSPEMGPPPC